MRVKDRRRHEFRRFAAGVAEHHALIAGALVFVARRVDSLRDVGRLAVDQAFDRRRAPMKVLLLVADLADRVARHLDQLFAGDCGGTADFSGEHHAIGRDQRLDTAASFRLGRQKSVDDRVGNAVANFVGMPLRHRFARKYVIAVGQRTVFPKSVKNWRVALWG